MTQERRNYEIGRDIFITSKLLRRYIDNQMPCDAVTTAQARVLGWIIHKTEEGEKLYQRDIEAEFQIRGSSVTSILKLMENHGFIQRASSKEDARLKQILPTEEGLRVHNQIFDTIFRAEEEMISLFTKEEIAVFRSMMERLRMLAMKEKEDTQLC